MKHFFRMSHVYVSWKFYRITLMREAAEHGWPIARHMMLVFPGNDAVYHEDLKYQYMIGTELLVAPVIKKGDSKVFVFLPQGIAWIHVWTNTTYSGTGHKILILIKMIQETTSGLKYLHHWGTQLFFIPKNLLWAKSSQKI